MSLIRFLSRCLGEDDGGDGEEGVSEFFSAL
jgi:hypothetical protein